MTTDQAIEIVARHSIWTAVSEYVANGLIAEWEADVDVNDTTYAAIRSKVLQLAGPDPAASELRQAFQLLDEER